MPLPLRSFKPDGTQPAIPKLRPGLAGEERRKARRIRCPLCAWVPAKSSRWTCGSCRHPEWYAGGCGTTWNTFDTRGGCPGCGHAWRFTACLRCHVWSRHDDWYLDEADS